MANPMKACESCKGTGKAIDNEKKMHRNSGNNPYPKSRTDMKKVPTSKPKNPSVEKGKK